MKSTLLSFAFFFCFSSLYCQDISGSWTGELDVQGNKLPLVFNIKPVGNALKTTMDSPKQGAKDIPVTSTTFEKNELEIKANEMGITYKGTLKNDKIEGTFTQGQMSLPLVLTKIKTGESVLKRPQTPKPPFDYIIEEVTFTNPVDNTILAGTLTLPKNKKQFPIVILISGSGQQNRDSEIFGHKEFWVIADDFAKKGIGVLRLDDRGVGGSKGASAAMTTQTFATDTNAAVAFLAQKGFENIGLIGHSEGGIIAPMVASQNKKVKFIVSMAGPGIAIDELLLLQTNALGKLSGASEDQLKSTEDLNRKLYATVKNYKGNDLQNEVKKVLSSEMKKLPKDQQPNETEMETFLEEQSKSLALPWYTFFLKINPDEYWSKIKIPVLALNGTLDTQVISKENLNGIKTSLEKANNKRFEIVAFPNLNHLFQEAKTGSVEEYGQLEQTIAPAVLEKMSSWILKL
jgi:alpha-beta hydrolase superfamily lysophospholipase